MASALAHEAPATPSLVKLLSEALPSSFNRGIFPAGEEHSAREPAFVDRFFTSLAADDSWLFLPQSRHETADHMGHRLVHPWTPVTVPVAGTLCIAEEL
jgi:hypothetical protein